MEFKGLRASIVTVSLLLAHASLASGQNKTWYFPDGGGYYVSSPGWPGVLSGLTTEYAIFNPNSTSAQVDIRCIYPTQPNPVIKTHSQAVAAHARVTLQLGYIVDYVEGFYSCEFHSQDYGEEVYVSRATSYSGWDDDTGYSAYASSRWEGSDGLDGIAEPRNLWYFPEGSTLNFNPQLRAMQNFFKIYNPHDNQITVTATFHYISHGLAHPNVGNGTGIYTKQVNVPGRSETDIWVNADPNLSGLSLIDSTETTPEYNLDAAVILSSSATFLATLTMYQTSALPWGVSSSSDRGTPDLSTVWYWAEASNGDYEDCESASYFHTQWGFDTWWQPRFYVFNPGDTAATVTLHLYRPGGDVLAAWQGPAPPHSRIGIDGEFDLLVNHHPDSTHPFCGDFAARITADLPVAATKIQYWPRGFDWTEGIHSIGSSTTQTHWIVPLGSTEQRYGGPYDTESFEFAQRLDTYLYLFNPNFSADATVVISYYGESGFITSEQHTIGNHSVKIIRALDDLDGQSLRFSADVSVTSGPGIVVEAYKMFNLQTTQAGEVTEQMWRAGEGGLATAVE